MDTLKGISFAVTIQKTVETTDLQWCAGLMAANEPLISLQRNYDHSIKLLEDPLSEVYLIKEVLERLGFIMIKQKVLLPDIFKSSFLSRNTGTRGWVKLPFSIWKTSYSGIAPMFLFVLPLLMMGHKNYTNLWAMR